MCDNLCRKIRDYFQSFSEGRRIIRRAEFLEVRYVHMRVCVRACVHMHILPYFNVPQSVYEILNTWMGQVTTVHESPGRWLYQLCFVASSGGQAFSNQPVAVKVTGQFI